MPPMLLKGPQCCPGVLSAAQASPVLSRGPQCHSGVPNAVQGSPVLLGVSPVLLSVPIFAPLSPQAAMPVESLVCADTATRVSSVLNRDVKQFGKKHMFDASEETCWNSDQGSSQWVTLDFPSTVRISQLHIQFQGGFSSRLCTLEGCRAGEEPVKISNLYPEDTNAMQISFAALHRFQVEETELDKLKITFENSTDFFGRIVVYHLGVLGQRL
ncbi:Nr2c2ap [Columba livia]|nr:Nr2c2ap [Columba livia]